MKLKLDHIGLVVQNIDEFTRLFRTLGFESITDPVPDPHQKVSASFVSVTDEESVHVELLEPTDEASPIMNFLKRRGGGLHHLCFEVEDIIKTSTDLEEKGFRMVHPPVECAAYDQNLKRVCSDATKISFFLVAERFLIELIEKGR
jgi:methylmalonyl-CoA/ethylmalonyl-CoA epimerase